MSIIKNIEIQSIADGTVQRKEIGASAENIDVDGVSLNEILRDFNGAGATVAGTTGLVPAPLPGDQDKFLKANGSWADIQEKISSVNGKTGNVTLTAEDIKLNNSTKSVQNAIAELDTDIKSLGTAASKNVPSEGDASSTEVVLGNDSRLADARNAADVYAWAKAPAKPEYTASEVGLGNVGNFKAVSTVANQGLTDSEKAAARANIGVVESSFDGSYDS